MKININNKISGVSTITPTEASANNRVIKPEKLNPEFITGLTEAEGSFSILIIKNNKAKYGTNIGLRFKISMLVSEIELLSMVEYFFGCGKLNIDNNGVASFEVKDIDSINKYIISHFSTYMLRGTKYLDYLSFIRVVGIINSKRHYTKEGIDEIIKIKNSMNSYREFTRDYCPSHTIYSNPNYIPINGDYINGFIAGDGCLALNIKDVNFCRMSLQISQHKNNRLLMLSIAKYFKSPSKIYYHDTNSVQLTLAGIKL